MSIQYDQYLEQHKTNVKKAFEWIRDNLPEALIGGNANSIEVQCCTTHDMSKNEIDEYVAYDAYFYGNNKSFAVVRNFRLAWLLHVHRNPHHWQYWVLINDDPNEGEIILDMPYNFIIEMICDWWSFSWKSGKLDEIFSWYDEHKAYMKLSKKTRETVENILAKIKDRLEE